MDNLNLVIMGRTGAGKSTLLNAIMKEEVAPTGNGQAVTKENKIYSKRLLLPVGLQSEDGSYGMVGKNVNLYDTVGLEIDRNITLDTLKEIQDFVKTAQKGGNDRDMTLVWFCINSAANRFEDYEIDLIKSLSIDYEIPFIIVMTRCYGETGELEKYIRKDLPEVAVIKVLAKDYKLRGSVVSVKAFGLSDLLRISIVDYDKYKVSILESKLNKLKKDRDSRIGELKKKGTECVGNYGDKALKIGFVPLGCIPVVHGLCIKMLAELNDLVGINSTKSFATDIFADVIIGLIVTPFMGVPLLSAAVAAAYVQAVGEMYLDALMEVIEISNDFELKNNELMSRRIKKELRGRKK